MKRFVLPIVIFLSLFILVYNVNAQKKVKEIKISEVQVIAIGGDRESID